MNRWHCAVVFMICFFMGSTFATPPEKIKVEFEWEEIFGAETYEIELMSKEKKSLQSLRSPNASFSLMMAPGFYYVRGRVYDNRRAKGEWSEPREFLVPPKRIENVTAPPAELVINTTTYTAPLKVSWKAPIGAHHFKFILLNSAGEVVGTKTTRIAEVNMNLRPGTYSYKIVPFTADEVEGEPYISEQLLAIKSQPVPGVTALKVQKEKQNTFLSWETETTNPTWFKLEHQKHFSSVWHPVAQSSTQDKQWSLPNGLKPGKYRVQLWNKNPFGEVSSVEKLEFIIKPDEHQLPK